MTPIFFALMLVAAFIAGLGANRIWRQMRTRPDSTEAIAHLAKEDLRWILATSPLAMWIYDLQTFEILDVNAAAIAQYGYSRDAFLKMHLTDLHPPGDEAPRYQALDQTVNSVESNSWQDGGQSRHALHDGRIIDVHLLAHPVASSGRQTKLIAAQNITAQVQAEADLRTREAWWRAVIEHGADMILVIDAKLKFVYVSPSVQQILGYDLNEIIGTEGIAWLKIVDDRSPILLRWWEQLKSGKSFIADEFGTPLELRIRDKAGQWRWLELILTRLQVPSAQGVIINAREITARVEAEKSLYAANENLQALIKFAPTPIIAQDRQQRVTVWNPAAEKLFGWRAAEVLGQPNPVAFAPIPASTDSPISLRVQDVQEHAMSVIETQSGRTVRMVSFRRDQSLITVSVSTGFIRDSAARVNGTISVLVDMTAQQNIQTKMLQQNDYLMALHDTALALLNRLDVDQLLSAILQRASAFLNTPNGFLGMLDPVSNRVVLRGGMGFYKPLIGTSMASTDGLIGQVMATKRLYVVDDYTGWTRRIDLLPGTHLYAAIGMPLTVNGEVIGVIGLIRLVAHQPFTLDEIAQFGQLVELACLALDSARLYAEAQQELAERSRVEAALQHLNADLEDRIKARTLQLQQREAELRTVLDSMSEGLVYFQTDQNESRIEFVNQAITEIVGYQPADLIGQSFAIFEPATLTDNTIKQDLIQMANNGHVWRSESSWRRADGSRVWVALSVRRVQSSSDQVRGVMIARDITAEKRLTDQKMRFIANASHELRTPLTHLKTRMYLIQRQPDRAAEHMAVLNQSITRMTRLVEDMLDTTRFEHGWGDLERREVIIQDLIKELLPNIQSETDFKKIKLGVEQPDQPLAIQADPNRLMQVLNNLAANAINYTHEDGQIYIRVQATDQSLIIEFEDSGVGLAPENFERVFEPFFRVELGTGRGVSLGLGLSIAREIVLMHGGSLTVTSQLQKGSLFRISLPILPSARPVTTPESAQSEHVD